MDPNRNFPLRKGTLLTCITWRNAIVNPQLNLYFTTPAEAIVSMFRQAIVRPFELTIGQIGATAQNSNQEDDLYLNTFYLNEDIIINPLQNSHLEDELKADPTLNGVRNAINLDCETLPERMGYVLPYFATIFSFHAGKVQPQPSRLRIRSNQIIVRMTTYIICRPNLLLPVQSFRIKKQAVYGLAMQMIRQWNDENPSEKISGGVILKLVDDFVRSNRDRWLEPVFVEPETRGLASSPIRYDPEVPPYQNLPIPPIEMAPPTAVVPPSTAVEEIPSRPVVPPSSMLNPQNPAIFIARQSSPEGTAYDAFASVPNDILRVMALNMTLESVARTCLTSQRFNQQICNNELFWQLRLQQDYGRKFSQDKDEQINEAARRKPADWTWKRYYAELSGNVDVANALDFANQLKDLPDVAEELRSLPIEQYLERVNEMRVQAGLGPIDFNRVEAQRKLRQADDLQNFRREYLERPHNVRMDRAPDEADGPDEARNRDDIFNVPRQPGERNNRLQPRNLFRVQPFVPGGVMGPVVEEHPNLMDEVAVPRENQELLDAYQDLIDVINQNDRPIRLRNTIQYNINRLIENGEDPLENLEANFERLRINFPGEWLVENEAIIREAIRNHLNEQGRRRLNRNPNVAPAPGGLLNRQPVDNQEIDLNRRLLNVYKRLAAAIRDRGGDPDLLHQILTRLDRYEDPQEAFRIDMLFLITEFGQEWTRDEEVAVRRAIRAYVEGRRNPLVEPGMVPRNVQLLFREFTRLLQAIRIGTRIDIGNMVDVIYNNVQARENEDPEIVLGRIRAQLDEINRYPDLANRWPIDANQRIINTIRLFKVPERRMAPQPVFQRHVEAENPPPEVARVYDTLRDLMELERAQEPEFEARRNRFFDEIIQIQAGNEAALRNFQLIADRVMHYPLYARVLGNYPQVLLGQFRNYLNRNEGPGDGMNLILIQEAQRFLPGFQDLINFDELFANPTLTEDKLRTLHRAFGDIYIQAGENQQDPIETLLSILQRLDESGTWDRGNDEIVIRSFQIQYLPLVRSLGELITLFREIINTREPRIQPNMRDRFIATLIRLNEQYPGLTRDLYRALEIFTELHQFDGRVLWNPNRDPQLLNEKLQQ